MLPQPAFGDGIGEDSTIFGGGATVAKQKRAVDFLDMNAAVLDRLGLVGNFEQLAGGFFGIVERAICSQFRA